MRINSITGKLISSIFITALLIYFMIKTTSPKIIFVPFLICSLSMTGKSLGFILNKEKIAVFFDKLFKAGFFLFWFGFLIVFCYISIRDKKYSMFALTIPFWLVGIYFLKRKLFSSDKEKEEKSKINLIKFVSALLVFSVLIAGLLLLIFGIIKAEKIMIFAGAFFVLGAGAFVLFALTATGCFDKIKTDVLGLYVGIVFTLIGIGIPAFKFTETFSLLKTVQAFGLWIFVPILMLTAGVFQIIKCIKNKFRGEKL